MFPLYKIWAGEFSKNDCDQVISRAQKLFTHQAGITQGEQHDVTDIEKRSGEVRWIERDNKHGLNDLFPMLNKYFKLANLHFGFNLTFFDAFQFAKYDQGDHYTWHPDWFLETRNNHQRKLSLTMQLTDPSQYDGGDFQFHELGDRPDEQELRAQGTILIFPSYLVHRITSVTRGSRHSLVAWYDGPEFR